MPEHIEQSVLPFCFDFSVFMFFFARLPFTFAFSSGRTVSFWYIRTPPPHPQNVFSSSSAIVIVSSRRVIISCFVLPCMFYFVFPPFQHCLISRWIMVIALSCSYLLLYIPRLYGAKPRGRQSGNVACTFRLACQKWTRWGLNSRAPACEADVIPLHHEPD